MSVVKRGVGINPSEKHLAAFAEKIFLNLWTYPNLYKSDGKELSDVLVVCGDDVLLFSIKEIEWKEGNDFAITWSRWYRSAIEESFKQLNGAARYLRDHKEALFLDASRKEKFPLFLPPPERRRTHFIAVALGADKSCATHYRKPIGYFPIVPDVKGASHIDTSANGFQRFGIGDVQPDGAFVHVLNEPVLELLGSELDTVTDFVRYLSRRERVIRSGHLASVAGEHDLLAHYLLSGGPSEEQDFRPTGVGGEWKNGDKLTIAPGTYEQLAIMPAYKARQAANAASYAWDRLLGQFTNAILAGEAEAVVGSEPEASEVEVGLRTMALEPRLRRRLLGQSIIDAMKKAEAVKADRLARCMVPGAHSVDDTFAFVLLILAHHGGAPGPAYTEYRKRRLVLLHGYCLAVLRDNRKLKRVVGVGIDASSAVTGRKGGTEDFYALEIDAWTPALEEEANVLAEDFNLLKPENVTHHNVSVNEFPQVPPPRPMVRCDPKWTNMWRVHLPDGRVTDMVNLIRANDALLALSRPGKSK